MLNRRCVKLTTRLCLFSALTWSPIFIPRLLRHARHEPFGSGVLHLIQINGDLFELYDDARTYEP